MNENRVLGFLLCVLSAGVAVTVPVNLWGLLR